MILANGNEYARLEHWCSDMRLCMIESIAQSDTLMFFCSAPKLPAANAYLSLPVLYLFKLPVIRNLFTYYFMTVKLDNKFIALEQRASETCNWFE